jgi:hypothetical protein
MSETTTDELKILMPFDKRECLSLKQAADRADRTESTLRNWCDEYGLSRRIGGKWAVSKVALRMYLESDLKALRAYHAGNRTDPGLVRYFEREGLAGVLQSRP